MTEMPANVHKVATAIMDAIVEADADSTMSFIDIMHGLVVAMGWYVGMLSQTAPQDERDRWQQQATRRLKEAVQAYQQHPEWLPGWMRRKFDA